ncbi:pantoate--beta-alanine ligase [Shouchella patagoniensis]|uniref:pantoate--beta-alanine ligase n=1 Tax=Shouchella patagoniensis TaxID=228576 RepID=UPI0009956E51|nr:pantoate--beta-alanine ligase [Shouchella patagoniensis]
MIVAKDVKQLDEALHEARLKNKTIGLVPTMGALHQGHLSLMEQAKKTCDILVVSIFVNPTQFGPGEDFESYPRQLEVDSKLAAEANCDVLFCPAEEVMYPDGPTQLVHVRQGADVLCGARRPGHFDGVATVVLKLLSLVGPHKAFFGQKDAQQLAIIKQLTKEFFLPVSIIGCPTVREEDGLAKSSRNVYLTPQERAMAPTLYNALQSAAQSGERQLKKLVSMVENELSILPIGSIDYVEAYEYPSLKSVDYVEGTVILAVAYQFSKARLIDHILIEFTNRNRGEA